MNSISYGVAEVLVDKLLGKGYLARADLEFKKLAIRGISGLIASADNRAGDLGTREPPPPLSQHSRALPELTLSSRARVRDS